MSEAIAIRSDHRLSFAGRFIYNYFLAYNGIALFNMCLSWCSLYQHCTVLFRLSESSCDVTSGSITNAHSPFGDLVTVESVQNALRASNVV